MKEKIILIGPGGHSKNIVDIIKQQKIFEIEGFVGLEDDLEKKINGYEVIGTDNNLSEIRSYCENAFITIGQIKSYIERLKAANHLKSLNFKIPKIISDYAVVSDNSLIGNGTLINNGAIVNSDSKIGNHCIINTNSVIEHDVSIGEFCHISTGVILNGGVNIGRGSFIGSGSIIREGISIPPDTVIKAGSIIMGWPLIK